MLSRFRKYEESIPIDCALHSEGRFVVQRHKDKQGHHLDVRLEQDHYLLGWRIEAHELLPKLWGQEKLPHDPIWLETDKETECLLAGRYRWFKQSDTCGYLELTSETGQQMVYQVERWAGFPARFQQALWQRMQTWQIAPADVPSLIEDGIHARKYAIRKLCGLGQFLDGDAFCSEHWEKALARCSLEEIYSYLQKWEARFSRYAPSERISRPEKIDESWVKSGDNKLSQEILNLVLTQQQKETTNI
ncbi:MAG TPA: hypothetical protein PLT82_11210 [Candidatus Hydrogenedens sp.]|nr:hypothetical protein [Candidatus Hydrogenedens sp.]HOK09982.1 hypothetical protein [Candidatus Hydrogenedens sp.]HOL19683.1 hypothetical protein [Candidatus Hydrogenedens sp.]HPP59691.1 hypothetical protein [Candidatus Hydrogenedens sp.]